MAGYDYGGAVIPWYEAPIARGYNYVWEKKPVAPPIEEVKQYIANETYQQEKMKEGSGGLTGFLNQTVNPILDPMAADPLKTAAMLAASVYAPYLIPVIAGADTALAGGSVEDVLKSAAIAYVSQAVGGEIKGALGGADIGLPSETPYIDLPDGEFLLTPDVSSVPSLLSEVGLTSAEIDQLTNLAPETGSEISAYTTPIEAPVIGQPYDVTPLTDPVTGEPFGEIERPLVDNYMDGFTSVSETGLATLPDEGMLPDLPGTTLLEEIGLYEDGFDPAPRYDFSPETPVLDVSPELDPTGSMATGSFGITPRQLLAGANIAKSLLGGSQESAAAPATQFRGTRMPSGEVDYSGILGLLQMQSPQRRSLLG
jgi:hypothetical protein